VAHGSDPLHPEFAELIAGRFAALADPMRLRLIDALRTRHEASVQELAEAFHIAKDLPEEVSRVTTRDIAGARYVRSSDARVVERMRFAA